MCFQIIGIVLWKSRDVESWILSVYIILEEKRKYVYAGITGYI